jgi:hypothetical protein
MKPKLNAKAEAAKSKRKYLSQEDVPGHSVDQALRIASAIAEQHGYRPTAPLMVAKALNMQPTSGGFRMLCGASIAYGFTEGGYNAPQITITPLGLRVVRSTVEGDDLSAKREALLNPRVIGEFLRRYDKASLPREDIALNVLDELGVPRDKVSTVLALILEGALSAGFIQEISGKKYVHLDGYAVPPQKQPADEAEEDTDKSANGNGSPAVSPSTRPPVIPVAGNQPLVNLPAIHQAIPSGVSKRVFITHGKNKSFIDPIKKLLGFGELQAVVSVERQSVSQPVPEKVMNDMRSCSAAIIHVDAEAVLKDDNGVDHVIINPNVLIEIGAAMGLYGKRFILLVREGVKLPSNLQGLYEVRYSSDILDAEVTLNLFEAINEMKKVPIAERYQTPAA